MYVSFSLFNFQYLGNFLKSIKLSLVYLLYVLNKICVETYMHARLIPQFKKHCEIQIILKYF
jgi:hypothetical protein